MSEEPPNTNNNRTMEQQYFNQSALSQLISAEHKHSGFKVSGLLHYWNDSVAIIKCANNFAVIDLPSFHKFKIQKAPAYNHSEQNRATNPEQGLELPIDKLLREI